MPIFDQGYQHWDGVLAGGWWRWLAIAQHGIRVASSSTLLKVFIIISWIPALILAGILCVWGMAEQKVSWAYSFFGGFFMEYPAYFERPATFRIAVWSNAFSNYLYWNLWFVAVVVMIFGPRLISQDLRFNAFPLYFSRPVRRIDYFLGKLSVIGFYLGLVTVVPAAVAWVLGVLFSMDQKVAGDTVHILLGTIAYGFIITLSAGLLVLALSSLSRSSLSVGFMWIGFFLVTWIVCVVLILVHGVFVVMDQANKAQAEAAHNPDLWDPKNQPKGEDALAQRDKARDREARRIIRKNQKQAVDALQNNWRYCVSYKDDVLRIGDALIGYHAALDQRETFRKRRHFPGDEPEPGQPALDDGPVYITFPWQWSAYVLAGLGGFSIWILFMRVKTLDRLR